MPKNLYFSAPITVIQLPNMLLKLTSKNLVKLQVAAYNVEYFANKS
jgi:hypothetical protein